MNLYRIDILMPDGSSYPVSDFLGPRLFRARKTANEAGRSAASYSDCPALLRRIQGAGSIRSMGFFYPDGTFKPY